jgi:hypothetical protein
MTDFARTDMQTSPARKYSIMNLHYTILPDFAKSNITAKCVQYCDIFAGHWGPLRWGGRGRVEGRLHGVKGP